MIKVMKGITFLMALFLSACENKSELAECSFGPLYDEHSKASAASVISMGRDDDDGRAKKWHIGGR